MQSFPVEYDFKTTKLKLLKNGHLKEKYKCLPYMITLPLSTPLNPIGQPNLPEPAIKQTILNATNTTDGWLNYNIVQNVQPNIVSVVDNVLYFNKYTYNYSITVDVINKGDTTTPLRFMAQNPISLLASNMNDVHGDETSYPVYNGKQIKFTLSGEYQFFYINYPTTNFNLNITINIDYHHYPVLICQLDKKCNKNKICDKKCKKCKKCNCFVMDGNGYLKNDCENIPVYTTRIVGDSVNKYLYPEFSYLRDLFYNITLSNSLPTPTSLNLNANTLTVIKCGISSNLWCNYTFISGDMVTLYSDTPNGTINQIKENRNNNKYRYSWPETPNVITTQSTFGAYFFAFYYWGGAWYADKTFVNKIGSNGTLNAGYYDNNSDYEWIAFGIRKIGSNPNDTAYATNTTFDMTITTI